MNRIQELGLTLTFAFLFAIVMMLTLFIVLGGILILNQTGLIRIENIEDFSLFWFAVRFMSAAPAKMEVCLQ